MSPTPSPPIAIRAYLHHLPDEPPIWLVGGVPRDQLLGRVSKDYDFVVDGEARKLARVFADRLGGAYYDLDRERDIGRVILNNDERDRITFDFARLRGSTIEDDLYGRDFTINAIAIRLQEPYAWIDPLGGVRDIKTKTIKACTSDSLAADPVRALRAVRFALDFDFRIEDKTREDIMRARDKIDSVSAERIRDELLLICDLHYPGRAFRLMDYMGIMHSIFPEFESLVQVDLSSPYEINAWEHTLAVLDRLGELLSVLDPIHNPEVAGNMLWAEVSLRLGRFRQQLQKYLDRPLSHANRARQILFLAVLYQAVEFSNIVESEIESTLYESGAEKGARFVEKRASDLCLSKKEVNHVARIVKCKMAFDAIGYEKPPSPRSIYRYFRSTHQAGVEIVLLALANFISARAAQISQDEWAKRVGLARILLEAFFEDRERLVEPPKLIDGEDIIRTLNLYSGPIIGELLEVIHEAQVTGDVTSRKEALALAQETLRSRGITM